MSKYDKMFIDVLREYHNADKWDNSKFEEMKKISNTHVGSVGQQFIEELCDEEGLKHEVLRNENGERITHGPWDIEIEGVKFELKTATEDTNNAFQFNHIRYHRPYDAVLCLGVSPNDLSFNLWSKADVVTGKAGNLVSMEKQGNASYKLTKRKNELYPITEFENRILAFVNKLKQVE